MIGSVSLKTHTTDTRACERENLGEKKVQMRYRTAKSPTNGTKDDKKPKNTKELPIIVLM